MPCCTVGPKSSLYLDRLPGYSPCARYVSTASAVFATLFCLPQLPSVFCCALSHQSTFMTAPSVFGSPPPFWVPSVKRPIVPGVLPPATEGIFTTDLIIATVSISAGFTDTSVSGIGFGAGGSSVGLANVGMSTVISTFGSSGGSS